MKGETVQIPGIYATGWPRSSCALKSISFANMGFTYLNKCVWVRLRFDSSRHNRGVNTLKLPAFL